MVRHLLNLLGRHPEARSQALDVGGLVGGLQRPEHVVEHGEEIAEQVDLPIPLGLLVLPARTLAEVLQLGLGAERAIVRLGELCPQGFDPGAGLRDLGRPFVVGFVRHVRSSGWLVGSLP
jgi:hypothetical protein